MMNTSVLRSGGFGVSFCGVRGYRGFWEIGVLRMRSERGALNTGSALRENRRKPLWNKGLRGSLEMLEFRTSDMVPDLFARCSARPKTDGAEIGKL